MARVGGWMLLLLCVGIGAGDVSCTPEKLDDSCEGASSHIREICQDSMGADFAEYFAEDYLVDCRASHGFMVRESRCAVKESNCEGMIRRCELTSISFVCDSDEICGEGQFCSADLEDCVECLDDDDCIVGRLCWGGLCLDEGNGFHDL